MPLSNPVGRKPMHTRTVQCRGYLRDDGLWDIEGHLVDTKPYDIPSEDRGGTIPAGEPLHGDASRSEAHDPQQQQQVASAPGIQGRPRPVQHHDRDTRQAQRESHEPNRLQTFAEGNAREERGHRGLSAMINAA